MINTTSNLSHELGKKVAIALDSEPKTADALGALALVTVFIIKMARNADAQQIVYEAYIKELGNLMDETPDVKI